MDRSTKALNPVSFLRTFIAQCMKVAEQHYGKQDDAPTDRYIEQVGLSASHCLEEAMRDRLGYAGPITPEQYADLIIGIKNRIGGNFSRASGAAGTIRVVNTCCPFGAGVREAPELCRMTASVFGGIAARNFGYAKVELRKRIALNDDRCEVCIYTDAEAARDKPGDEYRCDGDKIVSRSASAEARGRIEAKLREAWCPEVNAPRRGGRVLPGLIAESAAMRAALEAVEIVAPTPATVLITGETGVGKEVIARAIHAMSGRAEYEFVAVNCGAIPENLIESALFGHEKGAFTGAYNVHHGFFERADRGTLLFDEVDSLPVSAQVRLLRVLQEGEFERVGGRQTLRTQARIIAASNQDLEEAVKSGKFRHDLWYRLNVVPIHLPPLRERPDDIPPLVHHFLERLAEKYQSPDKILGERAWTKVMSYKWPGNLRELENVLECAFLFSRGAVIDCIPLPQPDLGSQGIGEDGNLHELRRRVTREAESKVMIQALKQYSGNVSAVARSMRITPRAVHMRLKSHGINAATYRIGTAFARPEDIAGSQGPRGNNS
jgi:Nif-specific regulatory protein/two-component system response regulator AtoC